MKIKTKTFKTVNKVRHALDAVLYTRGDSHRGAHYLRPDGSRGPIVSYLTFPIKVSFAVDRAEGGWTVTSAWASHYSIPPSHHPLFQPVEVGP